MPFFSDAHVSKALPGGENLDADQLDQLAQDASAVYTYIHHQPGATETQLRRWGESKGIGPDRMNQALLLLRTTRKIFELRDLGPAAAEELQPQRRRSRSRSK